MVSWLKYSFFKRKIVENLNFMHSLDDLATEICTQGAKKGRRRHYCFSDAHYQVITIDYV